jgi:hypothetical protein
VSGNAAFGNIKFETKPITIDILITSISRSCASCARGTCVWLRPLSRPSVSPCPPVHRNPVKHGLCNSQRIGPIRPCIDTIYKGRKYPSNWAASMTSFDDIDFGEFTAWAQKTCPPYQAIPPISDRYCIHVFLYA